MPRIRLLGALQSAFLVDYIGSG